MKTRLLLAALMAWLLWLPSWAQSGFNPDNPGDPGTPKLQYTLTLSVTPAQTGSINYSTGRYTAGEKFTLSAYANSDYRFVAWVSGTDTVSQSSNLTYTMPSHNAALTAVFTYSPGSPADPVTQPFKRQLSLVAEPAGAGSFNMNSGFYDVGSSHTLQAYANTDYTFTNWRVGDSIVGSNSRLDFTMPEQGLRIVGHFDYNPSSPGSPHKNHWNPLTGEVIVTDFTTGWLSDAVSEVIGGSSHRGEVLSITVAGRINDKDFGIANTYTNCSLLDLSRTTGVTAVPSYAFDHTNLESVYLPATVERIGAGAFEDCSQLASVTVYALTPPVLESNVFRNVPDGLVAYVPAGVIALYQEADGWKDLTLLPIQRDIRNLTVQLPTSAVAADYALMQLELTNTKSGQRLHYVMGDKTAYTFNNIIIGTTWNVAVRNARGDVFGQIDDVEVNDEDVTVTFSSLAKPHDVTLKVLAGKGADVSAQVETAWLDAEGNHLATGNTLNGMPAGEQVMCRITLPQRLAMTHHAPPVITHTVTDGDNAVVCRLDTIAALAITGRVTDARTGQPIGGATVSASQTYGGKYDRTVNGTTAADGTFAIAAHRVPTGITVAATDYVSQSLTCDTTAIDAILALGDLTLEAITGATVNISFTYTPCHAGDVEAEVQDWYDDYGNVDYTLRDTTAGRDITQFSVQYPKIVLLEDVADGHVLRLTATSRKGAFAPVNATASLSGQKATATFHLVEPGQIAATFAANDNAAVVGTLYDAEGKLVNTAAYGNEATLTFSNLADGCYTLVTMGKSTLFNTVYDLAQLPVTGLKAGVDYACDTVTVNAGLISAVSIDRVPTLDESKLYYTGDGTSFTSNKTSIVVGNYLTLTGRIDFKPAYATRVSDVQLTVSLPEACSFVENSVMVGNSTATYTLHNGQLTIPLGSRYTDRVRFCVVPTAGGDYAPSALVQFALDDSTMTQPIGAAAYTARDLSISVPSTVAKTTIPVSGTAQAMSQIDIYDADVLIGHTTALANGSWATTCELTDAYNLSQHPIHAVATTKQGLQLNTEQMTCTYDRDAIQVSKVTMYHDNPELHKTYEIVFDYQNPSPADEYYTYYIYNKKFSFTIDFTSNDTSRISDVVLYVKTAKSGWHPLKATFDEKQGLWVTEGEFGNMYDGDLPANVSVDYKYYQTIDSLRIVDNIKYFYDCCKIDTLYKTKDLLVYSLLHKERFLSQHCISYRSAISNKKEVFDKALESGFTEMDYEEDNLKCLINYSNEAMQMITETTDSIQVFAVFNYADSLAMREYAKILESTISLTPIITVKRAAPQKGKKSNKTGMPDVDAALAEADRKLACQYDDALAQVAVELRRLAKLGGFVIEGIKGRIDWIYSFPDPCPPPHDNDPHGDPYPGNDKPHRIDPSGYVYEGVSSNRLEGVKATCFYKETVEDMYGDPHENIVLWDATEHGQENPLFTDAMGMYRWDVPVGLWQVKFEKAGYETAYSEWLPVPPPQLDVNIAMRQMTQPTVLMAHAFQNAVELEFDKYMMAETLTTDNIIVTQNGTAVSGTVSLLNAESEGDGRYASRVRFNAAKPFEAEQVTLTVSSRVKSYAGLRMDGDFQQTFDVELEVSTIEADSITLVPYGGQRTLTVTVLPAAASAGKTLNVRSSSTVIASVDGESHTIDDHGQVTVTVTGELPGAATLLYSLDGYDLTAATIVNVVSEDQLVCAAPTASVASGSTVDKGTKVELSCSTPNATIYYTLDGSCPCEDSESRLTYDGTPIVIDHSLTIKAMAVAPGLLESDVVELTYKLNGNAVTDLAIDSEVKVFPVPMRDELHVTANGRTLRAVEVYATNGTLATAWRQTGTQATLNVSNLPAGVYVVVVTTSDGTCTRKVIKVD